MPLTDRLCRNLKFTDKNFKRFDGQGLFLFVTARGKYWRLKYRLHGHEKVLSIAHYPEFSLKAARTLAEDARVSIATGIDPSVEKKTRKKELAVILRRILYLAPSLISLGHQQNVVSITEVSDAGFHC